MTFFVLQSGSMPATFAVQLIVALPRCRRLVGLAAAPWGSKIMESVSALSTSLMLRTMHAQHATRCNPARRKEGRAVLAWQERAPQNDAADSA
jgi:hypothetical protein